MTSPEVEPSPVLLVGTYHMANPGRDLFNLDAGDVLDEKRQAEIEEVAGLLGAFAPTKVAIEAPWGDERFVEHYREYRKGSRALGRGEHEQLGFRVAAALGHEQVYPVDVEDEFWDPAMEEVGGDHLVATYAAAAAENAELQALLDRGTVREMLRHMNEPASIAYSGELSYLREFMPVAEGDNYLGATVVANWYRRNFKIAVNLLRLIDDADRVLVIYGQGHIALLRYALSAFPSVDLADPLDYL